MGDDDDDEDDDDDDVGGEAAMPECPFKGHRHKSRIRNALHGVYHWEAGRSQVLEYAYKQGVGGNTAGSKHLATPQQWFQYLYEEVFTGRHNMLRVYVLAPVLKKVFALARKEVAAVAAAAAGKGKVGGVKRRRVASKVVPG